MRGVAGMTEARLVINADDFGFSLGINRGIMDANAAGTLPSTSIMPTMPGFDDAVTRARGAGPRLGVGLHFTLTVGRPITQARSLVDSTTGEFLSFGRLARRAFARRVVQRDVEQECEAQLARCRAAGLDLTHLDSHHHSHTLPTIRAGVRRVARAAGIRYVRVPAEPLLHRGLPMRRLADRAFLRCLSLGSRNAGAPRVGFFGSSFFNDSRFEAHLLSLVDHLPAGVSELMVHPGWVDQPLPGGDWYTTPRERELAALLSPALRERLALRRVRVVHFGEL